MTMNKTHRLSLALANPWKQIGVLFSLVKFALIYL